MTATATFTTARTRITPREAARILGYHPDTLRRKAEEGSVPCRKMLIRKNWRYVYYLEELEVYLASTYCGPDLMSLEKSQT
jgi:hypothetical protein